MKRLKTCLTLALSALLELHVSIMAVAAGENTGFSDVDAGA